MSLRSDELRILSGDFDLELVKEVDLSSQKLSDISSLSFCSSLTILNLSSNCISDISPLSKLKLLKILVLNSNCISGLAHLSQLYQLNSLELAGNVLSSMDEFIHLGSLVNLKQLLMNDTRNQLSNPVCKQTDYFQQVVEILPTLFNLDRIQINDRTSHFCQIFFQSEDMGKSRDEICVNIDTEMRKHEQDFDLERKELEKCLDSKFEEIKSKLKL